MKPLLLLVCLAALAPAAAAQPRAPRRVPTLDEALRSRPARLPAASAGARPVGGSVYTITSAADTDDGVCDASDCTFAEALNDANDAGAPATIRFQIAGGGAHQTIRLVTEPPGLYVPLVIDGDTQGCADRAAGPCITFDARGLPDDAFDLLLVLGGDSQIRNLHLIGKGLDAYSDDAFFSAIDLTSPDNVVAGCVIGADRAGTTADPDGTPGTGDELGFVTGIALFSFTDEDVVATGNVVGGPAASDRNVVLGSAVGIDVLGAAGNTVRGNVVSANALYGIGLDLGATDTIVAGNLVGLDRTGTRALPNGDPADASTGNGIQVSNGGQRNRIGGPTGADANVVSGNLNVGIVLATIAYADTVLTGDVSGNVVEGNRVGTDASGQVAVPNGTAGDAESGVGIALVADPGQGAVRGNVVRGNLVSGNLRAGLLFDGAATTANVAEGNAVGLAADGQSALPNGGVGIGARGGASGNRAGSEARPNRIAFHTVGAGALGTVTGFDVAQNAFLGNGIALDLGLDGPSADDAGDADEGPNRRLNRPLVEAARLACGALSVSVRLDAPPTTAAYPVRITVYEDRSDPAGRTFVPVGSFQIQQAQAGQTVTGSFAVASVSGRVVAAATDAQGNTGEVGAAAVAVPDEAGPSAAVPGLRLAGPNPFRGQTALALVAVEAGPLRVDVVDALGRTVAVLHDGPVAAGAALGVRLDGSGLAPGVYAVQARGAVSASVEVTRVR